MIEVRILWLKSWVSSTSDDFNINFTFDLFCKSKSIQGKILLQDFVDDKIKVITPLEQDILKMEDAEIGEDKLINSYMIPSSINLH